MSVCVTVPGEQGLENDNDKGRDGDISSNSDSDRVFLLGKHETSSSLPDL